MSTECREGWSITESRFDPATAKAYEGLFTLGSGYLHVRGSIEEHFADCPQNATYMRMPANVTSEAFPETMAKWGTYVPGVYAKHPLLNWELVNLPWFADLLPAIDGERLDMQHCDIRSYSRTLDLATALLSREFVWHTRSGKAVSVRFERIVSAARRNLAVQRLTLSSDKPFDLDVCGGIDADVRTNGYDHFMDVAVARLQEDCIECRVTTDGGDEVRIISQLLTPAQRLAYEEESRRARLRAQHSVAAGERVVIEKRSVVTTSRDLVARNGDRILRECAGIRFDELVSEHCRVWEERWRASDVVIEGDSDSQLAMRCSIYHLLRAHVPGDDRVAIDAKGYAGDAYWGRFFWDTEMYLLPFFAYTDPAKARTLVGFRLQALDGARETAAQYGYRGARYPWESDSLGRECCPNWQYRDHEVHVTADVAYGLAHYAKAAPDPGFLAGPASEVIIETARYWLDRVDWRAQDDYPSILGVMGPDEYCPITSNNSYTNRMAAFNLSLAASIGEVAGVSPEETAAFAQTAGKLPMPRRADGLVLQCEEFDRLAEPRFDRLWKDRSATFAAQVSQERLYRSKCLKQGDVIMLMALYPNEFTDDDARRAWDYYLPYTTHDSSLSAGAHAIVACWLGLVDDAWEFWKMSSGLDLDVAHGAVGEGIHIAAAAANWQIAVFGFAGMQTAMNSDVLSIRPVLPKAWSRLAFPIVWKGCPVYIDLTPAACTATNRGGEPITVRVNGVDCLIAPGESAKRKT
jgi:trehalose/maltose hydrolase-like predicted phosphorylase